MMRSTARRNNLLRVRIFSIVAMILQALLATILIIAGWRFHEGALNPDLARFLNMFVIGACIFGAAMSLLTAAKPKLWPTMAAATIFSALTAILWQVALRMI